MQEKPSEIGFPMTVVDAVARGYKFLNLSNCRGCGQAIDWYETPNGRRMPVDTTGERDGFVSHFKTCPKRDQFRRKK